MGELVHLALRVGYLGDAFHGSQIQPDVVTVQGELQRVLRSLGWWSDGEHTMILGSRTDAGVNVRRNGGLLTLDVNSTKDRDRKLVRAMADRLPDHLAVLDATEVPEGWNPRLADHRVYRYRLEGMEGWWADDLDRFQRHLNLFVGTHDVRNFARMEEEKPDSNGGVRLAMVRRRSDRRLRNRRPLLPLEPGAESRWPCTAWNSVD